MQTRALATRAYPRAIALWLSVLWFSAPALAEPIGRSEQDLTSRLFAPCCWIQTLDVHESDLASSLRHEIHARLGAGERAQQIEDDLARRYGERIRAVPRDSDPRVAVPVLVAIAMILSFGALLVFCLRWRRRVPASAPLAANDHEHYDTLLDQALARKADET